MDKVYISYFYQIRYFNKRYLPISTAVWDPKWYHNNQDKDHVYIDKNGTFVGVRMEELTPGPTCQDLCRGRNACSHSPSSCKFLQAYRAQLDSIDFNQFESDLSELLTSYKDFTGVSAEPVFIVYETPDNPCSERAPLIEWFRSHGVECEEWSYKGEAHR